MKTLPYIGLLVALSLCSSAAAEDPLRIGAIFPFTGIQARQGQLAKTGIELALGEFGDFHPEILYEDSQSDTKQAVAAFQKLQALNKVEAVLTLGSPAAMALLPLANRDKVVLLAMVVVSGFSAPGDFGFRLMGTAEGFGGRIRELLKNELGKKRMSLVFVEDDYGSTYAKFFEANATLVGKESYLPGTSDFRPLLLRLKASKPDAVILGSWAVEAGTLMRQAKEVGLNPDVFVCPSACDNPDIAVSGAGATDSLIVVASASRTTPAREQALLERFHEAPTSVVLRFHDAIAVLRYAAKICGETTERSQCLKKALAAAKDIAGSSYAINFDPNGDIIDSYQLKIIRDGQLVPAKIQSQKVVTD